MLIKKKVWRYLFNISNNLIISMTNIYEQPTFIPKTPETNKNCGIFKNCDCF